MNDVGSAWGLDPQVAFLNHGSFGATPRRVLETQQRLREELERQPVEFLARRLEGLLDEARRVLATYLGADSADLVWVPNATTGVNAVLRSLPLHPGDELLTTDHAYNAVGNALRFVAERTGATVVVAAVPFPLQAPDEVVEAVLSGVTPRTRLAVLDHVTSPTGLVFPVEKLVAELATAGIDTLVDGAHGPGMLPLDLDRLGAAYYSGNCHKWMCSPKGAGFLHVRADRQDQLWPTVISHGANDPRPDRSRLHKLFDWTGTTDPTPYLAVPTAIAEVGGMLEGGWAEVRAHNRRLALFGRELLCAALGVPPPAPAEMVGSLASVVLPPDPGGSPPRSALYADPLQGELLGRWGIEVPIIPWPAWPQRLLRISAQLYNQPEQYERLAEAVTELFPTPG